MSKGFEQYEQIESSAGFAGDVLRAYEEIKRQGREVPLHQVIEQKAAAYELDVDQALQEVLAHPHFENLSDQERTQLTKNTVVQKATNWLTGFFTGSAKITSEESVALRDVLENPSDFAVEEDDYLESDEEYLEEDGEYLEENEEYVESDEEYLEQDEEAGVLDKATAMVENTVDKGKDQVGKVINSLGGQERAWAWQNGLYSGVKYSVQNDVSKAFALNFLKEFGDGTFKRVLESIPDSGLEIRDLDAIAMMEVKEFLLLMESRKEEGEFRYRGRKFSVEKYQPLYDLLVAHEQLSTSSMSIREALMLNFVSNEEERYAVRAIYVAKQMGLQTPAQWNMFRYYVGRWGHNRGDFNNALYRQVVGDNLDELAKTLDKDLLEGMEQRQGFLEAKNSLERKYQKSLHPLEKTEKLLTAEIEELEQKLKVKESGKAYKKDKVTTAKAAIPNDDKTRWQSWKERFLGWREGRLDKTTLTEQGISNTLKQKKKKLENIQTKKVEILNEKAHALAPLNQKLQTFDEQIVDVQNTLKAQSAPTNPEEMKKFIQQHNLKNDLLEDRQAFDKQWKSIVEAQAKDDALTKFFKKRPLRGSEELLNRAKTMQEAFEQKWSAEVVKSGGRETLKPKDLDPKVHEEFKEIQLQYNAAQKRFAEERKEIYRKIEKEQRNIKIWKAEVKVKPERAVDIEAARQRILAHGGTLRERQKELANFSKEFFKNNTATIKTMEAARKGTIQKAFRGVFWKGGYPFIIGASIVKQSVDVFKGENTLAQAGKDVLATGVGLLPVVGTYMDYKAWITGRDETGRLLSPFERRVRGLMVPVGVIADFTSVIGVGLWMRGGITATKVGIRGGMAGLRNVRTWQKARGVQEAAGATKDAVVAGVKGAKNLGESGLRAAWKGITKPGEVLKGAWGGLTRVPAKVAMHKGKIAIGGVIVGGVHMGASLEPVGVGEWEEGASMDFTAEDWEQVNNLWEQETNLNTW